MLFDFSDDLQLSFFFSFEHASLRGHPVHGPLLWVNVRYIFIPIYTMPEMSIIATMIICMLKFRLK